MSHAERCRDIRSGAFFQSNPHDLSGRGSVREHEKLLDVFHLGCVDHEGDDLRAFGDLGQVKHDSIAGLLDGARAIGLLDLILETTGYGPQRAAATAIAPSERVISRNASALSMRLPEREAGAGISLVAGPPEELGSLHEVARRVCRLRVDDSERATRRLLRGVNAAPREVLEATVQIACVAPEGERAELSAGLRNVGSAGSLEEGLRLGATTRAADACDETASDPETPSRMIP